ncbi:MAG: nitroreductase family protein [Pseudomonadota bacterium]
MELFDAIFTRRSIRKYRPGIVPENFIEDLLHAAMTAPSAGNKQPWHFVVIDDRSVLEEVPKFHPYSLMLHEASLAILVCGDENLQRGPGYFPLDCSAAVQNLLLAAHGKGLGAVWLGIYPKAERIQKMRELVRVPEGIVPFALVAVGHPAEPAQRLDRYDATRVHRNRW